MVTDCGYESIEWGIYLGWDLREDLSEKVAQLKPEGRLEKKEGYSWQKEVLVEGPGGMVEGTPRGWCREALDEAGGGAWPGVTQERGLVRFAFCKEFQLQ